MLASQADLPSFASNLREHISQSVACVSMMPEQAINQMVDLYNSVQVMIHHQMGGPYPTIGHTSAMKAGETKSLNVTGQKEIRRSWEKIAINVPEKVGAS